MTNQENFLGQTKELHKEKKDRIIDFRGYCDYLLPGLNLLKDPRTLPLLEKTSFNFDKTIYIFFTGSQRSAETSEKVIKDFIANLSKRAPLIRAFQNLVSQHTSTEVLLSTKSKSQQPSSEMLPNSKIKNKDNNEASSKPKSVEQKTDHMREVTYLLSKESAQSRSERPRYTLGELSQTLSLLKKSPCSPDLKKDFQGLVDTLRKWEKTLDLYLSSKQRTEKLVEIVERYSENYSFYHSPKVNRIAEVLGYRRRALELFEELKAEAKGFAEDGGGGQRLFRTVKRDELANVLEKSVRLERLCFASGSFMEDEDLTRAREANSLLQLVMVAYLASPFQKESLLDVVMRKASRQDAVFDSSFVSALCFYLKRDKGKADSFGVEAPEVRRLSRKRVRETGALVSQAFASRLEKDWEEALFVERTLGKFAKANRDKNKLFGGRGEWHGGDKMSVQEADKAEKALARAKPLPFNFLDCKEIKHSIETVSSERKVQELFRKKREGRTDDAEALIVLSREISLLPRGSPYYIRGQQELEKCWAVRKRVSEVLGISEDSLNKYHKYLENKEGGGPQLPIKETPATIEEASSLAGVLKRQEFKSYDLISKVEAGVQLAKEKRKAVLGIVANLRTTTWEEVLRVHKLFLPPWIALYHNNEKHKEKIDSFETAVSKGLEASRILENVRSSPGFSVSEKTLKTLLISLETDPIISKIDCGFALEIRALLKKSKELSKSMALYSSSEAQLDLESVSSFLQEAGTFSHLKESAVYKDLYSLREKLKDRNNPESSAGAFRLAEPKALEDLQRVEVLSFRKAHGRKILFNNTQLIVDSRNKDEEKVLQLIDRFEKAFSSMDVRGEDPLQHVSKVGSDESGTGREGTPAFLSEQDLELRLGVGRTCLRDFAEKVLRCCEDSVRLGVQLVFPKEWQAEIICFGLELAVLCSPVLPEKQYLSCVVSKYLVFTRVPSFGIIHALFLLPRVQDSIGNVGLVFSWIQRMYDSSEKFEKSLFSDDMGWERPASLDRIIKVVDCREYEFLSGNRGKCIRAETSDRHSPPSDEEKECLEAKVNDNLKCNQCSNPLPAHLFNGVHRENSISSASCFSCCISHNKPFLFFSDIFFNSNSLLFNFVTEAQRKPLSSQAVEWLNTFPLKTGSYSCFKVKEKEKMESALWETTKWVTEAESSMKNLKEVFGENKERDWFNRALCRCFEGLSREEFFLEPSNFKAFVFVLFIALAGYCFLYEPPCKQTQDGKSSQRISYFLSTEKTSKEKNKKDDTDEHRHRTDANGSTKTQDYTREEISILGGNNISSKKIKRTSSAIKALSPSTPLKNPRSIGADTIGFINSLTCLQLQEGFAALARCGLYEIESSSCARVRFRIERHKVVEVTSINLSVGKKSVILEQVKNATIRSAYENFLRVFSEAEERNRRMFECAIVGEHSPGLISEKGDTVGDREGSLVRFLRRYWETSGDPKLFLFFNTRSCNKDQVLVRRVVSGVLESYKAQDELRRRLKKTSSADQKLLCLLSSDVWKLSWEDLYLNETVLNTKAQVMKIANALLNLNDENSFVSNASYWSRLHPLLSKLFVLFCPSALVLGRGFSFEGLAEDQSDNFLIPAFSYEKSQKCLLKRFFKKLKEFLRKKSVPEFVLVNLKEISIALKYRQAFEKPAFFIGDDYLKHLSLTLTDYINEADVSGLLSSLNDIFISKDIRKLISSFFRSIYGESKEVAFTKLIYFLEKGCFYHLAKNSGLKRNS